MYHHFQNLPWKPAKSPVSHESLIKNLVLVPTVPMLAQIFSGSRTAERGNEQLGGPAWNDGMRGGGTCYAAQGCRCIPSGPPVQYKHEHVDLTLDHLSREDRFELTPDGK
ncbi:hypothetical protein PDE_00342 [Penicillium oxalicum 114-2]|uniref:Uncharacterized protein n=1 Tax=Penicillium oxalicum (strain 114-2 / CGMCC 5302) TaxID=933388 RepID=S7Z5M5_PENO1|nr:hypothetical protein PDE_00342 [Penicillium oxalicum 114-2]